MSTLSLGSLLTQTTENANGNPPVLGRFDGNHILVPLLTRKIPPVLDQLKIATTLARARNASLTIINPVSVPEQIPKAHGQKVIDSDDRALLEWAFKQADDGIPHVDGNFVYTRDVVKGVLHAARTHDVDTLVVPSGTQTGRLRKEATKRIAAHVDADVVVVNGKAGFESPPSILLPVAGGPHSGLAADVATTIAADCRAWIDILHVIDEDAPSHKREHAQSLVDDVYHRIARPESTTTWVHEATDTAEAIVEQSRYYGLTIIGAPTKGRLRQFIFGSTNTSVRKNAASIVLSVRNNSPTLDAE
ncbi:universal stress protein [Halobacteriales archaeon SW_10_68_16]|nr:MAG: universal stress protein [Halobacteriales archaeon SW_10_68_16]